MPIAYIKKAEFLARDLEGLAASSRPAVNAALRGAGARLVKEAVPRTPILTGFMRSRWRSRPLSDGARVENDAFYLPWVNRVIHPGFADDIAGLAPRLMREELARVRITSSIIGKYSQFEYPPSLSAFIRPVQTAQRNRGVF